MNKLIRGLLTRPVVIGRNARDWTIAMMILSLLKLVSLMPVERSVDLVDRLARRIGPRTSRHRLALYNLARAYPEKTEAEREAIAREMWGNMARLAAEYVYLDDMFDYHPDQPGPSRIEVSGIEIFRDLRENPRPFIVFTAHTGNFELLPIAAASYELDVTALFRPPNNPHIARKVLAARRTRMGHLVPSRAGAAIALARKLEAGGGVGLLVDQKFHRGAETTFFGLPLQTNPLLGKLARQFDCEVYPARCIRLPNNRFRLEIEPAMTIPRLFNGSVDIPATAQMLNDKVESWVRQYPGQWQWFHDRWAIKHMLKDRN